MKVIAIKSFVGTDGNGKKHRIQSGDELELPPGTDWLKAGLVEPVEGAPAPARRTKATSEKAVNREKRG